MPESYRVTRVTEVAEFDDRGRVSPMMRVEFYVGTHGPFTEKWRKEQWDPNAMRARLDEFVRKLAMVTGE